MFRSAIATVPESTQGVNMRFADEGDLDTIVYFLRELAAFEQLSQEMTADEDTLAESLFGDHPYAECIIAEMDGVPAGFAMFFHSFSPYQGKPNLYVEGLYVKPDYRKGGIGMQLFRELANVALERDCARMEWRALDWNIQSIIFYRKLGAQPLANWVTQRLEIPQIEALAREAS